MTIVHQGYEFESDDCRTRVSVYDLGNGKRGIRIERPRDAMINAGDRAGVDLTELEALEVARLLR